MPPELVLFGEQAIVDALEANPPAAVLVTHKDTSEYGLPFFGRDYGNRVAEWVFVRYSVAWTDPRGGVPLAPETVFGVSLLEPVE